MDTEPVQVADLVSSWVTGWALARGLSVTQLDAGAFHARPDDVYRREEVIVAGASWTDIAEFEAQHRGDDQFWLTAIPAPVAVPDGLTLVKDSESFMTHDLTTPDLAAAPRASGAGLLLNEEGVVAKATMVVGGELAASGFVAVAGDVAVFDRILTQEGFRRGGLGSDVMAELTESALQRGARRGLLIASPDGQALYRRLGWRAVLGVATYAPTSVRRTGDGR